MYTKIGFVDSGIGGLNVLKETMKLLPNVEYVYYVDSVNNPYGEKTEEELFKILCIIIDKLKENGCYLIVLACNTATTLCINRLRHKYQNIEFVGSEPAIKLALDSGYEDILVLGTTLTIESARLHEIIAKNKKKNQKVYLHASKTLANNIEFDRVNLIKKELFNLKNQYSNLDCIVLGCTHYCFIKRIIAEFFPNVQIVDGNIGISRRVYNLFKSKFRDKNVANIEFILTNNSRNEQKLCEILNKI